MRNKLCAFLIAVSLTWLINVLPAAARLNIENNSHRQTIVSGTVTDEKGVPVAGATVKIKGTDIGAVTKTNGGFQVESQSPKDILVFSFVGYISVEREVGALKTINVQLRPEENNALQDVVVVAYGTQKKITTIGAQSSIKPAELKQPSGNLSNAIAGRVAGVVAVQRSGEPGAGSDIWIRGIATFNNSSPLYLVDGVERPISYINPEDVESFSILKDASATALYGVRGANGVVIVTTKQGTSGKPKFNFDYLESLTSFTRMPQLADGITYMNLANEAKTNRGEVPIYSQNTIQQTLKGSDPYLYPNVNWLDEVFNKYGHNRRANLNINGGSPNVTYYVSLGYYDEKGLLKTDGLATYNASMKFNKVNFLSNLKIKATKSTTIDLGLQGYMTGANNPGTSATDVLGQVFATNPVAYPVTYPGGLIGGSEINNGLPNPWASVTQSGYSTTSSSQVFSNLRLTQGLDFLLDGLSATTMVAYDASNTQLVNRTKKMDTWFATSRLANGELNLIKTYSGTPYLGFSYATNASRRFYLESAINYTKTFSQDHSVSGLLLYNRTSQDLYPPSDFATSIPYRTVGLSGRATYAFKNRYFAEYNFGYNGSENFNPDKRFGFFPSYGIGWAVSEEPFFKSLTSFVQLLKFRFSHGFSGNGNIGGRRFAFIDLINNTDPYYFGEARSATTGLDISDYAVDVTWETSRKTNLGVELRLLKNTSLTVDLFKEHRTDIFLRRNSLPIFAGVQAAPFGNLGIVDNKGIDISLEHRVKINNLNVNFFGNFNFSRNKIVENDNPVAKYPWLEQRERKIGGQRMGYIALGLFKDQADIRASSVQIGDIRPGDIKYADLNGDNKIDGDDQTFIGYGNVPEIVYGFGFNMSYRNFEFSAFAQGIDHVDITLAGSGITGFQGNNRSNVLSNITDRWTPANPNPNAFYPLLSYGDKNNNYQQSTWWLKDGSFLRVKDVRLSYTLPKTVFKKVGFQSIKIYAQAVNPFTFSEFKLWDVELGTSGNGDRYPQNKTYSIGLGIQL